MSVRKRKLPQVKDTVFEEEDALGEDFMTKTQNLEIRDTDSEGSEGEEEAKETKVKGTRKTVKGKKTVEKADAPDEEDGSEEEGNEESSDDEVWYDLGAGDDDDDEDEDYNDEADVEDYGDDEDGEWETESEEEEEKKPSKKKGSKGSRSSGDSGVDSDHSIDDWAIRELKKKTSVLRVLARIRSEEGLRRNTEEAASTSTAAVDGEQSGASKASDDGEKKESSDPALQINEYEYDSSDEEDLRNTVGNIPMNWYDDYSHIGYDLDGKPIIKPKRGDTLDQFLNRIENPDHGRTVYDKQTGQDVRLSDKDLDLVKRVMTQKVPDPSYEMYPKWIDHFTHEVMDMPLSGRPEHKRSFIPSKKEAAFVRRRARQLIRGTIKYNHVKKKQRPIYDLWEAPKDESAVERPLKMMIAPKMPPPGHEDSYRPPLEYCTGEMRKRRRRFPTLRNVPQYYKYITELYERCLDLYIAPRKKIMKPIHSANEMLPKMPSTKDLRPFPTREALRFVGHRSIVRTISIHPSGQFLASGSDDRTVKIWEVSTGRCLRSFDFDGVIRWVSWNPNKKLFMLAIVVENNVYCMNPETYLTDKLVIKQTNTVFQEAPEQGDDPIGKRAERLKSAVTWRKPTATEWNKGIRVVIEHFKNVKQIVWHRQGDYFCTVMPHGDNRSVIIHQLSRWRSQVPFTAIKAKIEAVDFHPKMPMIYVVTQNHIRVYNLQRQIMVKNIKSGCKWISSIAIHPGGEHFLIGSYDRKVNWFEMECTKRPHILKFHKKAIRSVAYHRKYPLFASGSDDGRIIVSHGMVYNDWVTDPLIVPVKELIGHWFLKDLCVLDLAWHPYEPFLLSAGADTTIRLWC